MSFNALSLAKLGIGFGALAVASIGLLSPAQVEAVDTNVGWVFRQQVSATAHEARVSAVSFVRVLTPEVQVAHVLADSPFVGVLAESRVLVKTPILHRVTPAQVIHGTVRITIEYPTAAASTHDRRASGFSGVAAAPPSTGSTTPEVPTIAHSYYAFWSPGTIHNPTAEMLSVLLDT